MLTDSCTVTQKLSTGLGLATHPRLEPEHHRDNGCDDDECQTEITGDPLRVLLSLVSGVKIDCIQRLWLACRKMGGHTLSVLSRSQACAKLIATATNVNVSSQNHGEGRRRGRRPR